MAPQIRSSLDESVPAGEAGPSSGTANIPRRPPPTKINPAMAGVSGILRKEQEQQEEVDKNMKEAFQDLNGLMVRFLITCSHNFITMSESCQFVPTIKDYRESAVYE